MCRVAFEARGGLDRDRASSVTMLKPWRGRPQVHEVETQFTLHR